MKNVGSVLPISVYPHLEQLLGYDGTHRFVVFDITGAETISYRDGTHYGQCSPAGWHTFYSHPRIAPLFVQAHLSGTDDGYCLLLDREKRQLFSFQKMTAETLLHSEKNREVASEAKLVEKLEGLFDLKKKLDLVERKELPIGTTAHFLDWMNKCGTTVPH